MKLTAGRVKQTNFKMKRIMFTAFAVGLGLTASVMAQVPSYVPTNGLVGWWPFNGNANDESGNGNNGTVNGAILTSDRNGNLNSAYSFNNSEITTVISSSQFSSDYTISIWVRVNSNNASYPTFLVGNNVLSGFADPTYLITQLSQYKFVHYMQIAPTNAGVTLYQSNSLNLDTWYHLVISSTNQQCKMYIDGIENSIAGPIYLSNFGSYLHIGNGRDSGEIFIGQLDDIAIFNRSLSQQEISDLYNGCSASIIAAQPTNQSVTPTNSAQFIVNANSGSSFQWQTDLGFGFQNLSNAGQYSGANNDTLVVSNATISNSNQQFRCILNSGSCSDTSNIAILTVSTAGLEELNPIKFNLYPNPAQSSFEIQTNLVFNKIEIRDMQGRVVKTENAGKTINISSLQQGTYLVQLIDEKSKVISVKRIIKE
jgi:hypothetical protein